MLGAEWSIDELSTPVIPRFLEVHIEGGIDVGQKKSAPKAAPKKPQAPAKGGKK